MVPNVFCHKLIINLYVLNRSKLINAKKHAFNDRLKLSTMRIYYSASLCQFLAKIISQSLLSQLGLSHTPLWGRC